MCLPCYMLLEKGGHTGTAPTPVMPYPVRAFRKTPLRRPFNALQYCADDGSLLPTQRPAEGGFIALAAEDTLDGGSHVVRVYAVRGQGSLHAAALHHSGNQLLMPIKLLPPAWEGEIRLPALGAVRSSLAAVSLLAGDLSQQLARLPYLRCCRIKGYLNPAIN